MCPLLVVHDDVRMPLTADDVQRLVRHFGEAHVYALSSLQALMPDYSTISKMRLVNPNVSPASMATVGSLMDGRRLSARGASPGMGRRLRTSDMGRTSFARLWVWALPWHRLCTLDSDMVVVRNIDELLHFEARSDEVGAGVDWSRRPHGEGRVREEHQIDYHGRALTRIAAVPGCMHNTDGFVAFNGGMYVFAPSVSVLRQLMTQVRHRWLTTKRCEIKVYDQSILNAAFRRVGGATGGNMSNHPRTDANDKECRRSLGCVGTWAPLSSTFNYPWKVTSKKTVVPPGNVLHYLGPQKPWHVLAAAARNNRSGGRVSLAVHTWRESCSDVSAADLGIT
jgi:lipopolysaccharide biosynthesis glycosyltransferase